MDNQLSFLMAFISLLIFLVTWKISKAKASAPKLPPGPPKFPIIGNLHQLVGSDQPHHRLRDMAKKYGPIMHLQLGQLSTIVISSPEAAKQILKTHDIIFATRPFNLAASVIAYNARDVAFAPYGHYWKQLRKFYSVELLSAKRVQAFRSIMGEEVSKLVESISSSTEGSPVNLTTMSIAASYCIISRTAFGTVLNLDDSFSPIVQEIFNFLGGFRMADFFPSIKLLQLVTGTRRKLQKLHQEADWILDTIIKEHQATRKTAESIGSKVEADDLVHLLLNQGMYEQDIKAVILDMFLAGHETSSSVVEWTMSEMMKHPEIMKRAQEEVRRFFNGKGKIDETMSLKELTYLNSIIKETLRLHVPGPLLLPREAQESVKIWGYEIPKKTQVTVNAWAIGRDPHYWVDADRFCPERFLDSSIDYKGNDFEFIPFGAGRRICPGMLFGFSVVDLMVANLLYYFDWKLPGGMKPEDLDMSENFGASLRRKNELYLIPIPYNKSLISPQIKG